ncbi:MAG: uroporphyrinogen decarboxylase family protein [Planctomycetota bacterium]
MAEPGSHAAETEARYARRMSRYVTAMRNEKPDMVPIRPFLAEFTGNYAGYDCQELTHDYTKAFDAACKCAADFDFDAVVPSMVYVWSGMTEAIGLRYYGIPGIDVPPNRGFQYLEPPEDQAFMKADEYDQLIEDPTGYMYHVWLPRVTKTVRRMGEPITEEHNMSFLKGGMSMMQYFTALGAQVERLRRESGTVSALGGIFKAPMDILADKLRGYIGLANDLMTQPDKVLAACEALMPHLCRVAQLTSDPDKNVPIGYWMHRGCIPFVSPHQFQNIYWPTVKPIIEELWAGGNQTLFYAEGNWDYHLETFTELPDLSIVYHVDQGDIFKAREVLGDRFCLSGGIPNFLLAYRSPQEVRECCKKVLDGVGRDGGYILDASAIVQNDGKVENIKAMTDFAREYGVYSDGHSSPEAPCAKSDYQEHHQSGIPPLGPNARPCGTVVPWERKRQDWENVTGNMSLLKDVWESVDSLAHVYIWQLVVSF